jgi:hypothetical protein
MLVIDLINRLKNMDPKLEVYFAHPSHDYWRSELASAGHVAIRGSRAASVQERRNPGADRHDGVRRQHR